MDEHYLAILLEEMSGNIKLVLEGHAVLENKIEALDEKLSKKIDLNTVRIEALDEKLSARIDSVEENLSNRIDEVDEKLSARIDAVEENLGNRIDAVATDLAAHRRDTEIHRGYQVSESLPAKK